MKRRKYAISGIIFAISMLLAISMLTPVAADTKLDGGDLDTTVDIAGGVTASATGTGGYPTFTGSPVKISVDWTMDDDHGQSEHNYIIEAENSDTQEEADDWVGISNQGGPAYNEGTMTISLNASLGETIEVRIHCNVTCGINFDEDEDTYAFYF